MIKSGYQVASNTVLSWMSSVFRRQVNRATLAAVVPPSVVLLLVWTNCTSGWGCIIVVTPCITFTKLKVKGHETLGSSISSWQTNLEGDMIWVCSSKSILGQWVALLRIWTSSEERIDMILWKLSAPNLLSHWLWLLHPQRLNLLAHLRWRCCDLALGVFCR